MLLLSLIKLAALKGIKAQLRLVYIFFVLVCAVLFAVQPQLLEPEQIAAWIQNHTLHILGCYILFSCIRGLFFLPSTPFVVLGIVLFPEEQLLVFSISMITILLCAGYLYWLARYLEFEEVLSLVGQQRFEKIQVGFKRAGVWIVFLWSFFPLVPTDAMALVAGALKMNFLYYLIALALGEMLLVGIYVGAGSEIIASIR